MVKKFRVRVCSKCSFKLTTPKPRSDKVNKQLIRTERWSHSGKLILKVTIKINCNRRRERYSLSSKESLRKLRRSRIDSIDC